jgi:FdrA protein
LVTGCVIRKNEYHDSVFLMRVARRISEQKGILQAAALMGTEKNKILLAEIGIGGKEVETAAPGDLIIAVQAEDAGTLSAMLGNVEGWLRPSPDRPGAIPVRTLEEALGRQPHSNLAMISIPGQYAAREARRALERGLNVFLFSDNVPVKDELALKEYAREKGLMVMGPDCGTAIIGGKGIGFANAVRRGPIGVIGASGTGIQEFTTLVHHAGSGISHALGTGSRDLSDEIGGISVLSALAALESDPQTKVIALISKPPGEKNLARLLPKLQSCAKPLVACFLGSGKNIQPGKASYQMVRTLDEAAAAALRLATGREKSAFPAEPPDFRARLQKERSGIRAPRRFLRGIFAGGTFCYQAQQILRDAGMSAYSNAPLEGNRKLPDSNRSLEHTLVDMGADEYTSGRPHPMIDSSLRRERILQEAEDPEVAVILLDFILGFNASPDPAGDLAAAITRARAGAKEKGGFLSVVASVCGTEGDSQDFVRQVKKLEETGAVVFPSSARATEFCVELIRPQEGGSRG